MPRHPCAPLYHLMLLQICQVDGEDIYVVLNAGCRDKDIEHIQSHVKKFQVGDVAFDHGPMRHLHASLPGWPSSSPYAGM